MTMRILTDNFQTPKMKIVKRQPANPRLVTTDVEVNKDSQWKFTIRRMSFLNRIFYGLGIFRKVEENPEGSEAADNSEAGVW